MLSQNGSVLTGVSHIIKLEEILELQAMIIHAQHFNLVDFAHSLIYILLKSYSFQSRMRMVSMYTKVRKKLLVKDIWHFTLRCSMKAKKDK